MECDVAREALSARLDGERQHVPAGRVDAHLESCADCRTWLAEAAELARRQYGVIGREQLQALGLGNKAIAGQLHISEHTAKFHVGQILAKLDAGSRSLSFRLVKTGAHSCCA